MRFIMAEYRDMLKFLAPAKNGDFEISTFEISHNKNFRAMIDGIPEGKYLRLTHHGEVVMSDTPMEKRTNLSFLQNAYGDVLIGGLGLGMIVLPVQGKENVVSITIVEKNMEVIDMICSQISFNEKVKIVCADVFEWKPPKGEKYDCIYMDIWNFVNSDVYKNEMKPLKRKYSHYLKPLSESPGRFNKCWAEINAKNNWRLY